VRAEEPSVETTVGSRVTRSLSPYQTLGTTIVDPSTRIQASFVLYPPAAVDDEVRRRRRRRQRSAIPSSFATYEVQANLPWSQPPEHFNTESGLIAALQTALGSDGAEALAGNAPARLREFCVVAVREQLIPVRQSPITGESLAELLAKGSGPAVGGLMGSLVGSDSWLLFLTVPAGMIVGGAAYGVATALQQGLHQKILGWIVGDETADQDAE
jgi:hypothetical protein